jgi:hypothetical protein
MSGNRSRHNGHKPYIPPPPERITYQADGLDVALTISRADGSLGTYRTLLMEQAKTEEKGHEPEGSDLRALGDYLTHLFIYPSLTAATVKAEGFAHWPLPFADYLALPEPLLIQWEAKVFELNPHWRPKQPDEIDPVLDEELQKKAPASEQG